MNQIKSYFYLYVKIILSDKVPFLWTIGLPLLIGFMYGPKGDDTFGRTEFFTFISLFWVYIILSTYLNGIGLQLARMREQGLMKTYIMISGNKYTFVFAVILAQIMFAGISLLVFTSIMTLYYGYFSIVILLVPILILLISIPFAIASAAVTLLPAKISSMTTLANILLFPLFLLARELPDHFLSFINPFFTMEQAALGILDATLQVGLDSHLSFTIIFIIIYFVLGVISLRRLNLISLVTR